MVINRVRVLERGPHTSTQLFQGRPPGNRELITVFRLTYGLVILPTTARTYYDSGEREQITTSVRNGAKHYCLLTEFWLFSHLLCRKSVNMKKFSITKLGVVKCCDRISLNCICSCTRQEICIIIV